MEVNKNNRLFGQIAKKCDFVSARTIGSKYENCSKGQNREYGKDGVMFMWKEEEKNFGDEGV